MVNLEIRFSKYNSLLGCETPERCFNLAVNMGVHIGPTRVLSDIW